MLNYYYGSSNNQMYVNPGHLDRQSPSISSQSSSSSSSCSLSNSPAPSYSNTPDKSEYFMYPTNAQQTYAHPNYYYNARNALPSINTLINSSSQFEDSTYFSRNSSISLNDSTNAKTSPKPVSITLFNSSSPNFIQF
jgi:hypothetical protein